MSRQGHHFDLHISKKKRLNMLDRVVNIASFLYPLCGLPQVIMALQGQTEGVSLASWAGFTIFSTIFLFYGYYHKIKPMIITNGCWTIINLLVVVLTILDRYA